LKTSFHIINNEPAQRIWDEVKFEIEILGIDEPSSNSSSSQSDIIRNFMRPFDLAKAPLLRAALRKIADEKHLLMIDMHHIVSDAVSINIVVNNFMIFYREKIYPTSNSIQRFCRMVLQSKSKESSETAEGFLVKRICEKYRCWNSVNFATSSQSFEGNS
jgi:hypothetical protein